MGQADTKLPTRPCSKTLKLKKSIIISLNHSWTILTKRKLFFSRDFEREFPIKECKLIEFCVFCVVSRWIGVRKSSVWYRKNRKVWQNQIFLWEYSNWVIFWNAHQRCLSTDYGELRELGRIIAGTNNDSFTFENSFSQALATGFAPCCWSDVPRTWNRPHSIGICWLRGCCSKRRHVRLAWKGTAAWCHFHGLGCFLHHIWIRFVG